MLRLNSLNLVMFLGNSPRKTIPCSKLLWWLVKWYYWTPPSVFFTVKSWNCLVIGWHRVLERTISKLELELAAARVAQETILNGAPASESLKFAELATKRKYLMVIGINTAFSSRKRRDSVRATWMPQGVVCSLVTQTFILYHVPILSVSVLAHWTMFNILALLVKWQVMKERS